MRDRDYAKEYREYHGKPEQIKNRAARNGARRKAAKAGLVRKGDGMEVDHKRPLSKGGSNHRSNLRIVTRKTNRTKGDR
jgi:5-methylcytosine-specific restriction endonuclease McrA